MKIFFFRTILCFILILLIGLSTIMVAQTNFEGKAEAVFSYKGNDTNIKYYAKDGMARVEIEPANKGLTKIYIAKEGNLYMLFPSEKKFTESTFRLQNRIKNITGDSLNKNIAKTNDKQQILGYNAEKWSYKGEKNVIELWNAPELGNFINFNKIIGINQNSQPNWLKKLTSEGLFPLLVVQLDQNDKEIRHFEVKKIEKSVPSSELFSVPSDYRKMSARQ